jgi:hypothetical protein
MDKLRLVYVPETIIPHVSPLGVSHPNHQPGQVSETTAARMDHAKQKKADAGSGEVKRLGLNKRVWAALVDRLEGKVHPGSGQKGDTDTHGSPSLRQACQENAARDRAALGQPRQGQGVLEGAGAGLEKDLIRPRRTAAVAT